MRIRNLNVGVESITRRQVEDEVHLPEIGELKPQFLPLDRQLDAILHRPALDERLPALLQPDMLDPDLLDPRTLTETREETRALFAAAAGRRTGRARRILDAAAAQLAEDVDLDDEIRRALAALLRG